jgi:hypothetical protein
MPGHPEAQPGQNVQPRAQTRCQGALSLHPSAPEPLLKCRLMWNSGPKSLVGHPEMKPEEESLATGPELVEEVRVEPGPPSAAGQVWRAGAWHSRGSPAANRQGSQRIIRTSASKVHLAWERAYRPLLREFLRIPRPNLQIVAPSARTGLDRRDIAMCLPARVYCRGA